MAQLAILQSLMDQPSEPENKISTLPAAIEECEAQIKQSKQAAEELVDIDNFICHITLTDPKEGVQYLMKNTTMMLVDLSGHGTKVGASMVFLTYILSHQLLISGRN